MTINIDIKDIKDIINMQEEYENKIRDLKIQLRDARFELEICHKEIDELKNDIKILL